jgi:serine/threonine protein kinase
MIRIDSAAYQTLVSQAEILEANHCGPKVLRLADGSYLKLFRRKHLISSALWLPYARRFAHACQVLAEYSVPCPKVIAVYRIPSIARDAVHYHPLPGQSLRQLIQKDISKAESHQIRYQLGAFVALLHNLGIYFRSLHLGNIIQTPQNTLGLVDLADIRFYRHPLSRFLQQRNFNHIMRYPEDAEWINQTTAFQTAYCATRPNIGNKPSQYEDALSGKPSASTAQT